MERERDGDEDRDCSTCDYWPKGDRTVSNYNHMGFVGSFLEPSDCCQENKVVAISNVSEHVQQQKPRRSHVSLRSGI